jgi:hypothetical protein
MWRQLVRLKLFRLAGWLACVTPNSISSKSLNYRKSVRGGLPLRKRRPDFGSGASERHSTIEIMAKCRAVRSAIPACSTSWPSIVCTLLRVPKSWPTKFNPEPPKSKFPPLRMPLWLSRVSRVYGVHHARKTALEFEGNPVLLKGVRAGIEWACTRCIGGCIHTRTFNSSSSCYPVLMLVISVSAMELDAIASRRSYTTRMTSKNPWHRPFSVYIGNASSYSKPEIHGG